MPLILGTNSIKDIGYDVANSLRFNDGDSASMSKSSSSGDRRQFTISAWVKRGVLGTEQQIYGFRQSASNVSGLFFDGSTDRLKYSDYQSSFNATIVTNRVFRDPSAWYHIVCAVDTDQGTDTNRIKIYVNGTQETSFSTATYPSQNTDLYVNVSGQNHYIGTEQSGRFFDGYMAEVVFIDGTQNAVTDFGEFDSDSPTIWKPIDVSGLTFGTNGFYLDFEDSNNLGNDANGGTDFTVSNLTSIDQSTDTCTNNGLTLNPIAANSGYSFSDGNLSVGINGVNDEEKIIVATFGASSGKWYWEIKNTSSSNPNYIHAGYSTDEFISNYINGSQSTSNYTANNGYWNGIQGGGNTAHISIFRAGSSNYALTDTSFVQNEIGMFALDLDNRKCWFGVNGNWIKDSSGNVGNPLTGANPTWNSNDLVSTDKIWLPSITGYFSQPTCSLNFGSPPYSVSSSNSDGDGVGNYEYSVPTGFKTWNTKNLAEFG